MRKPASPATTTCTILAGGSRGSDDGKGAQAQFDEPCGVAVDHDDSIYVADRANHAIRKILADGTVTTVAGRRGQPGFADGRGVEALFRLPRGLAVDVDGYSILVADQDNHAIRRVRRDGTVETVAGLGVPGLRDGPARTALLSSPRDVAVDAAGNVLFTDMGNSLLRKVTPDGMVRPAGTRHEDLVACPKTVAVDDLGQVYLCDSETGRLFHSDFKGRFSLLSGGRHSAAMPHTATAPNALAATRATAAAAGQGDGDSGEGSGACASGGLKQPCGMAVLGGSRRGVVLADFGNNCISLLLAQGEVEQLATGLDPPCPLGGPRQFNSPWGVAFTTRGELVITDMLNYRVCLLRNKALKGQAANAHGSPRRHLHPVRNPRHSSQDLELLVSEQFADVTFLVGGFEVKAHKAILASRSDYFRALLSSGMMETHTATITITDTDPDAFRAVLRYLYCGRLQLCLRSVLRVLALCQQYMLEQAVQQCTAYAARHLQPATAVEWLVWAHVGRHEALKGALMQYWAHNFGTIQAADPLAMEMLKGHPDLLLEILSASLA